VASPIDALSSDAIATAVPRSRYGDAVALGWQMAVLYRDATRQQTVQPDLPDTLPTIHEVSAGRRTEFAIAETMATLGRLEMAGATDAATKLDQAFKNAEGSAEDVKRAAYVLHMEILRESNAQDRALGKAYELGKELADTCPAEIDVEAMAEQLNRYRLDELGRWLADLATLLPDHASRAVRVSMARWKIAAKDGAASPLFNDKEVGTIHRELDRQVQIWRSLLTGEKQATDMLGTDGYARAVSFAVSDTRRLILGYTWRFLPFVIGVLALLAAGVWGVTEYEATSKVIASLTAIAAALGLSWKGIATTLGRVAGEIERPIWQGSLDLVVADAITQQPATSVRLTIAAKVAPAAGGSPDTHSLFSGKVSKALPPGTDSPTALASPAPTDTQASHADRNPEGPA
jgi:hypothetical protein